ncbi:MAG: hypothetical protein NTZ12_11405 [Candidatus Aminicenantes bacterium]|nr:hypothetical protein [Candidatus Aminicenantes bacterium]
MKNRFSRLLAITSLAVALPVFSQVLPFEILGLKDGIPQSQVLALAQVESAEFRALAVTAEGLWLGTTRGAIHYEVRPRAPGKVNSHAPPH